MFEFLEFSSSIERAGWKLRLASSLFRSLNCSVFSVPAGCVFLVLCLLSLFVFTSVLKFSEVCVFTSCLVFVLYAFFLFDSVSS